MAKTKLPALPAAPGDLAGIKAFLASVKEIVEIREGGRGTSDDKTVTVGDLNEALKRLGVSNETVTVTQATNIANDAINKKLNNPADSWFKNSWLYKKLTTAIRDVEDLKRYPDELKEYLGSNLSELAKQRQADVKRTDIKIQEATRSLAAQVEEVTAAIETSDAAVQEVKFAFASETEAIAGDITTVTARLDDVGGITIEQAIEASVSVEKGPTGSYMLRMNKIGSDGKVVLDANGKPTSMAAFGLVLDNTGSEFIIDADTFRMTSHAANGTAYNPLTIDSTGIKLNSNVQVGNNLTVADIAKYPITSIGSFASAPTTTNLKQNSVYKNTTDGNSYILNTNGGSWSEWLSKGTDGKDGKDGTSGSRGSITISASGQFYGGYSASSTFSSLTGLYDKKIGDTINYTQGGSYYRTADNSDSWTQAALVVRGDMIVEGTIYASAIHTNEITNMECVTGAATSGAGTVVQTQISLTATGNLLIFVGVDSNHSSSGTYSNNYTVYVDGSQVLYESVAHPNNVGWVQYNSFVKCGSVSAGLHTISLYANATGDVSGEKYRNGRIAVLRAQR